MGYCYGCMEPCGQEICSVCGFRASAYQADAHHLRPGTRLRERYVIGKVLGEGGFGITYIGMDTLLEEKVAIKEFYMDGYVIRDHTLSDDVRFSGTSGEIFQTNRDKSLREAKMLAKFKDEPGIVNVRDLFREHNTAYIVMDFLDGGTLRDYVKAHGTLSGERALQILEPVFQSLAKIHEHGLIHRDISPDNIMLMKNGEVKLLDFGATRETSEHGSKSLSVILKPGYAPFEQYQSRGKQGPWTDVYALCATMYRCITGITPDGAMDRVIDDLLVPPAKLDCNCAEAMSDVLMRGLSVRPEERYQSVPELWDALNAAMEPPAEPEEATEEPTQTEIPAPTDKTTVGGTELGQPEEPPATTAEPLKEEKSHLEPEVPTVQPEVPAVKPEPKSFIVESEPTPAPKAELKSFVIEPQSVPEQPVAEAKPRKKRNLILPLCAAAALIAVVALFPKGATSEDEHYESEDYTQAEEQALAGQTVAEQELDDWAAAEQGDAEAQYNLGNRYYNGDGVEQDYAQAVEWYQKAAEQGHIEAQYKLADCFYYGEGVEGDYTQAIEWYQKAADQGHEEAQNQLAEAQYQLGQCYYYGDYYSVSVEQDYVQAVEWYQKAADQGHATAQNNLGVCYYDGTGVEQNHELAKYWWQKAAEQGNEKAQAHLDKYF